MPSISFSVDAALLRELGERLVGRPHIALAELIKNSYDADATSVRLKFDKESIEVIDNGNGMSFEQFRDFWMRIGSPHKQLEPRSKRLNRPLTGSKGVGRLAVQFLASRIDMTTVSIDDPSLQISASVDWATAVRAGDLTNAHALYNTGAPTTQFADGSAHGTSILLRNLRHAWLPGLVGEVAREIWSLEPPFRPNPRLEAASATAFRVEIESADDTATQVFREHMRAYLDIWHARLVGRLDHHGPDEPVVNLSLEFADGSQEKTTYLATPSLHAAEFEIRIYHLVNRQGRGVRVEEAREYLNKFGGVHIYDGGFHLPYYGADTDWLNIERDHSHRLSISRLLPKELQVERGLNFLPTQSRIFGVVHVDTAFERDAVQTPATPDVLTIQVTRDRLVENEAFSGLQRIVRWALDYYAMVEARRVLDLAERTRPVASGDTTKERREDVLARYKDRIPPPVLASVRRELRRLDAEAEAEHAVLVRRTGLVAALATAGIAALGFDHELGKQLRRLDDFVTQINDLLRGGKPTARELERLANSLSEWIDRAKATRSLFAHLADEDNRAIEQRLNARAVVQQSKIQLGSLLRGTEVDTSDMDRSLLLPPATFAEWSALFQNVFLNAVNAMMDSRTRKLRVRTQTSGKGRTIIVEDTGIGVPLASAEKLFEPFQRGSKITPERRALGLGGTGLGLTIVRMIATSRSFSVGFTKPSPGFNTAFQIDWREPK